MRKIKFTLLFTIFEQMVTLYLQDNGVDGEKEKRGLIVLKLLFNYIFISVQNVQETKT